MLKKSSTRRAVMLVCSCALVVAVVSAATAAPLNGGKLSKDDLQFLFGDNHPEDASYVHIAVKSRTKRDSGSPNQNLTGGSVNTSQEIFTTPEEKTTEQHEGSVGNTDDSKKQRSSDPATIDFEGLNDENPIESLKPNTQTISEMEQVDEEFISQKESVSGKSPGGKSFVDKSDETSTAGGAPLGENNVTMNGDAVRSQDGGGISPKNKETLPKTPDTGKANGGKRKSDSISANRKVDVGKNDPNTSSNRKDAVIVSNKGFEMSKKQEVLVELDESNMDDLMLEFMRKPAGYVKKAVLTNDVVKSLDPNNTGEISSNDEGDRKGQETKSNKIPERPFQPKELQITITDSSGSMDFNLRSNTKLFSRSFKVVVRDSVNETDSTKQDITESLGVGGDKTNQEDRGKKDGDGGSKADGPGGTDEAGEVVEIRKPLRQQGCVYVGQSEENPDVQVALTNCDGQGFTGLIVDGNTTRLIRPARNSTMSTTNGERAKRDVGGASTDEGLHIMHSTTGRKKCGISNLRAMRAPRHIVKIPDANESNDGPEDSPHPVRKREVAYAGGPTVIRLSEEEFNANEWYDTRRKILGDDEEDEDDEGLGSLKDARMISKTRIQEEQKEFLGLSYPSRSSGLDDLGDFHQLRGKREVGDLGSQGRRYKRMLRTEYMIETAVFVDDVMYDFVRKGAVNIDPVVRVQDIVFAIMNGVHILYTSPSMKTKFSITLVELDILKSSDAGPAKAGGEIEAYLSNFCTWQNRLNRRLRNEDPKHIFWDHGLLLSGLDLYSGTPEEDSVIGLAWVSAMCNPSYSCTINEGTSFEAVYVITHEMGHSLGMSHDGSYSDHNSCAPDKNIMSASTGPGKVTWSTCSNDEVKAFLTGTEFPQDCLSPDDQKGPPELDFTASGKLPGERYTVEEQCTYALGAAFSPYRTSKSPYENVCRETWCQNRTHAMRTHPALEGTSCALKMLCIAGQCVSSDNRNVAGTSNVEVRNGDPATNSSTTTRKPTTRKPTTTLPPTRAPRGFSLTDIFKQIRDMFRNLHSNPSSIEIHHLDQLVKHSKLQHTNYSIVTSYDWVLRNMSQCNVTCGGGFVMATIACSTSWGVKTPNGDVVKLGNSASFTNHQDFKREIEEVSTMGASQDSGANPTKQRSIARVKRNEDDLEDVETVDIGPRAEDVPNYVWKPFAGTSSAVDPDADTVNMDLLNQGRTPQTAEGVGEVPLGGGNTGNGESLINPNLKGNFMMSGNDSNAFDGVSKINSPKSGGQTDSDAEDFLCAAMKKPPAKWVCNIEPCSVRI